MAANYSQAGYWPARFWLNYWAGYPSAQPLVRTEPVTYAPNSYYPGGYWADVYWPRTNATLLITAVGIGSVHCVAPENRAIIVEYEDRATAIDIESRLFSVPAFVS